MSAALQRVLVTGGSGFVAGHCIVALLDAGFRVRTTIRSPDRESAVRAALGREAQDPESLTFAVADLTDQAGWADAVDGCDVVLHVASPVPHGGAVDEEAFVAAAREGTLRVLRAAREHGVRRVVLTSAFHAVGFGHGRTDRLFTEDDWTVLDGPGVDAYGRSKTLAERAAWDFAAEADAPELVAVNPVAVLGPVPGEGTSGGTVSGANEIVRRIVSGALPGYPDFWMPIVDVRDVATAHVAAATTPAAAGKRFLLTSGRGLTLEQIGAVLRRDLGGSAHRVPRRRIPSVLIRLAARVNASARMIAAELGVTKRISNDRARRVLGWEPRDPEQTVVDTARSMIDTGAVEV